jgi:hypothetical protein
MRMDSKQLEQLLEKYWNCDTSLEEEKQLRDLFRGEVPENLKDTAELFRYFEAQQMKSVGGTDFDTEVIKKMKQNQPRGRSVKMIFNYARIAAGLIVVVTATYFVRQEVRKAYPPEIVDTYSDPKLALEETKKALMMISKGFNKAQREAGKIKAFNEAEEKVQKQSKAEDTI